MYLRDILRNKQVILDKKYIPQHSSHFSNNKNALKRKQKYQILIFDNAVTILAGKLIENKSGMKNTKIMLPLISKIMCVVGGTRQSHHQSLSTVTPHQNSQHLLYKCWLWICVIFASVYPTPPTPTQSFLDTFTYKIHFKTSKQPPTLPPPPPPHTHTKSNNNNKTPLIFQWWF